MYNFHVYMYILFSIPLCLNLKFFIFNNVADDNINSYFSLIQLFIRKNQIYYLKL